MPPYGSCSATFFLSPRCFFRQSIAHACMRNASSCLFLLFFVLCWRLRLASRVPLSVGHGSGADVFVFMTITAASS